MNRKQRKLSNQRLINAMRACISDADTLDNDQLLMIWKQGIRSLTDYGSLSEDTRRQIAIEQALNAMRGERAIARSTT